MKRAIDVVILIIAVLVGLFFVNVSHERKDPSLKDRRDFSDGLCRSDPLNPPGCLVTQVVEEKGFPFKVQSSTPEIEGNTQTALDKKILTAANFLVGFTMVILIAKAIKKFVKS